MVQGTVSTNWKHGTKVGIENVFVVITMLTFKIRCRTGSAIKVKTSWVSGNIDIFIPTYSADGLGFTVALQA